MKIKFLIFLIVLFIGLRVSAQEVSVDVGYPVVDKMETQMFGVFYPQENIYKRLERLELKVFGKTNNAALSDRVENLSNKILGNTQPSYEDDISPANQIDEQLPSNMFSQIPQNSQEYPYVIYELEKKLLGSVYIDEPVGNRLSRLEMQVFGQVSDTYPPDERIQRLCAYSDAQNSDDSYEDQAKLRQYSNGAQIFSILFMILQAFL